MKFEEVPFLKYIIQLLQKIKPMWLHGLSFYDLIKMYSIGIFEGALSYHASAVAFSFFMALFPFTLFILNLIPYIPIQGFQQDFLEFIREGVPPNTYDAIYKIINDILNNSYNSLLSTGFIMSIFLMTNGVNAILGGFENSQHILLKRKYFHQYFVSLAISVLLSFLLVITIATIVVFEVFIQKTKIQDVLSDSIPLIELGRYVFVILMILFSTSLLVLLKSNPT